MKTLPILRGFEEVKKYAEAASLHGAYICGGYARWCCSTANPPMPPNDIDVFLTMNGVGRMIEEDFKALGCKKKRASSAAITMKLPEKIQAGSRQVEDIQIIIKDAFSSSVEDIISSFDFNICQAAIVDDKSVIVTDKFAEEEPKMVLTHSGVHSGNPTITFKRAIKYIKRGYSFNGSLIDALIRKMPDRIIVSMMKMFSPIKNLDIAKFEKALDDLY